MTCWPERYFLLQSGHRHWSHPQPVHEPSSISLSGVRLGRARAGGSWMRLRTRMPWTRRSLRRPSRRGRSRSASAPTGPSHRRLNLRCYANSDIRARAPNQYGRHREQVACFWDLVAGEEAARAPFGERITGILRESSFWQIKGDEIEGSARQVVSAFICLVCDLDRATIRTNVPRKKAVRPSKTIARTMASRVARLHEARARLAASARAGSATARGHAGTSAAPLRLHATKPSAVPGSVSARTAPCTGSRALKLRPRFRRSP